MTFYVNFLWEKIITIYLCFIYNVMFDQMILEGLYSYKTSAFSTAYSLKNEVPLFTIDMKEELCMHY
jgi:hypothetical protein